MHVHFQDQGQTLKETGTDYTLPKLVTISNINYLHKTESKKDENTTKICSYPLKLGGFGKIGTNI